MRHSTEEGAVSPADSAERSVRHAYSYIERCRARTSRKQS